MRRRLQRLLVMERVCTGLCLFAFLVMFMIPPVKAVAQSTTFTVSVAPKTAEHPFSGRGWGEGYVIDGEEGPTLTLVRGVTYTFQMQDVAAIHPFYISTSESGAGGDVYDEGVENTGATGNETLTFTPGENTPDVLYYNCLTHEYMGGTINVVDEDEPTETADIGLELVAHGLTQPVYLTEAPDDTGRLFIVDQDGQIHILHPDGTLSDTPFLDISDRMVTLNPGYDERGLLGLAFHPNYAENGRFFVYYSAPLREGAPDSFNNTSTISEFLVSGDDPNVGDPESETIILQIDKPQGNHAGGTVAFGPDGYLYISIGDGGGADDVANGHVEDWYDFNEGGNGQDITQNLMGSILRIDVDNPDEGLNYGIPDDNPFVDTDALPEHWAYGFRNPYRFSFDMGGTNELFVGDAGQDFYEEVSIAVAGGNYGWNVKEGTHCFDAANPENPPAECPDVVGAGHPDEGAQLIDPIIEFVNSNQEGGLGLTVVGGVVYRGSLLEGFDGRYIFGAWSAGQGNVGGQDVTLPGRIFAADRPETDTLWSFEELEIADMDSFPHFVLGFGQDLDGEVYVLATDMVGPTGNTGRVYRFVAPGAPTANEPDTELPSTIVLDQNYPNPFNPTTTITYHLATATNVRLTLYDVLGREIRVLVDSQLAPGDYSVTWDATDAAGRAVPSGVYLYRLETDVQSTTKAMTLIR